MSPYQVPPQNLAIFGVRHDLYNHVRFEMSQKSAAAAVSNGRHAAVPRATSSDFFVQQKSTKVGEEKVRDRSTSRKGLRVSTTLSFQPGCFYVNI
jgi:hypothetical protein